MHKHVYTQHALSPNRTFLLFLVRLSGSSDAFAVYSRVRDVALSLWMTLHSLFSHLTLLSEMPSRLFPDFSLVIFLTFLIFSPPHIRAHTRAFDLSLAL